MPAEGDEIAASRGEVALHDDPERVGQARSRVRAHGEVRAEVQDPRQERRVRRPVRSQMHAERPGGTRRSINRRRVLSSRPQPLAKHIGVVGQLAPGHDRSAHEHDAPALLRQREHLGFELLAERLCHVHRLLRRGLAATGDKLHELLLPLVEELRDVERGQARRPPDGWPWRPRATSSSLGGRAAAT